MLTLLALTVKGMGVTAKLPVNTSELKLCPTMLVLVPVMA